MCFQDLYRLFITSCQWSCGKVMFSVCCLSVYSQGGSMWLSPTMPWTSPYRNPPPGPVPFSTGTSHALVPILPLYRDLPWRPRLETCSNLFTCFLLECFLVWKENSPRRRRHRTSNISFLDLIPLIERFYPKFKACPFHDARRFSHSVFLKACQ